MPRLLQVTDTHVYAAASARFDGVDTRATLTAVLAAAAGESADGLLLTGDLSMDGSAASYRWLQATLAGQGLPWWAIPGNHDEPAAWPAAPGAGFGSLPRVVSLPPWRLLLLSTRVAASPAGALGAAQLAWLRETLAGGGDAYDLVAMHHPPLAVDSPWIDAMGLAADDATALWRCLAQAPRLRAVICGHVHQVFDRQVGTVRVLTAPSTCVQFLPRARHYAIDSRAPGYRVLDLGDDGCLATRVVRVALRAEQDGDTG